MSVTTGAHNGRGERGQVIVIFAILVPVVLALSGVVIGLGNWFVHAKHLQTKADAGAIAGGGAFEFPCFAGVDAIDQRIAELARRYSGPVSAPPVASTGPGLNPQVGGVPTSNVHAVLNGPEWYDNDGSGGSSNPGENLDFCDGSVGPNDVMRLEVKLTEDNSFPLASLIPLFPDIKRKATVELFQTDGMLGLLPIAVRAPKPQSALAIFYDEASGTILDREYLIEKTAPGGPGLPGLPAGLQGWSTEVAFADPRGWASVTPLSSETGVVVAISYRGACGTWGGSAPASAPPGVFIEPSGKCLEDGLGNGAPSYTNINQIPGICNQGGNAQVANCYYTNDPNAAVPNDETVLSGLQFIRSYTPPNVGGNGAPQLGSAYLAPSCASGYGTGYFATFPNVCNTGITADFDIGTCRRQPQGQNFTGPCLPSGGVETRTAANAEVKYTLVTGTGNNNDICDFGNTCDLLDSGSTSSYSANGQVTVPSGSTRYVVALRVRLKQTIVPGANCDNQNFSGQCEWYFVGSTRHPNQPTNATIFGDPVNRAFRGNSVTAGSIRWLRMKADRNPCGGTPGDETAFSGLEGSVPNGGASCFVVEVGLKGGLAADADDPAYLFNDGVGTSQLGYVDCTPSGQPGHQQNIVYELIRGCPSIFAPHSFDYDPLCPSHNDLFTTPNPGPGSSPWNVDWPPIRCVKTRATGQGQDLTKGLNSRFYFPTDLNGASQPPNSCPPQVGTGYVQGRNYWKHDPTAGSPPFGYRESDGSWNTHFADNDARLVTIFLTTPESFTGSGQGTFPITGAISVYITGYGRIQGNGNLDVIDPCAGPPPSDADFSGGSSGGRVVWGHFINRTVFSAGATPSGVHCNPGVSSQPCVPVLVE
jgi:hypothetical protein